jgi:hypothetical protein
MQLARVAASALMVTVSAMTVENPKTLKLRLLNQIYDGIKPIAAVSSGTLSSISNYENYAQ